MCLLYLLIFGVGVLNVRASTIMGIVYDNRRNPLPDVDVELLDDLSRPRTRIKTDSNGRYSFPGLGDGRYILRVLPFRYNLNNEEQFVEISTVSAAGGVDGATTIIQDFYLTPKKGDLNQVEASVVFVQDIPKEAKQLYEKAVNDLDKKKNEEGLNGLKKAINISPKFFLALQRLGREYFLMGKYDESFKVLLKAADVNNKSPLTFYLLGFSLHKLGYNKSAIIALNQAAILSPASSSIFFVLGITERAEGLFTDAENHLKQAIKLSQEKLPDAHWQLALLYGENLKRYADAADELEKFLKAKPEVVDIEKVRSVIKNYREKAAQKK